VKPGLGAENYAGLPELDSWPGSALESTTVQLQVDRLATCTLHSLHESTVRHRLERHETRVYYLQGAELEVWITDQTAHWET
jgi:hypothetical protein